MSGAAFEGLGGLPHEGRGNEAYTPGDCGYDRGILAGTLAHFASQERDRWLLRTTARDSFKDTLRERLLASSGFDGQAFLDEVVRRYDAAVDFEGCSFGSDDLGMLLNPVLQVLYDLGKNCLSLDLGERENYPGEMPCGLSGREEAPLVLTYTSPCHDQFRSFAIGMRVPHGSMADGVRHCSLRLEGWTYYLGTSSEDSVFHFDGHAEKMGHYSKRCAYYLHGVGKASVSLLPQRTWETSREEDGFSLLFSRRRGDSERILNTTLWQQFWQEGNRILIPDGAVSWKEVTP